MVTEEPVFVAVIDTLVPADQDPGAVSAGVPQALRKNFEREPWREKEYQLIVHSVARAAQTAQGRPFETLDLETRTDILQRLLRDKDAGDARIHLALLRVAVLRQFYCTPAGQRMLGYTPPLYGYPDYPRPPA